MKNILFLLEDLPEQGTFIDLGLNRGGQEATTRIRSGGLYWVLGGYYVLEIEDASCIKSSS